jgi:hypothetical protein
MSKKPWIIGGAVAIIAVAWYAFRPELLFVDEKVSEALPPANASSRAKSDRILARGEFRGIAHETAGSATVHELADGRRILRLTGFSTSNGPDVRVLLVASPDAEDSETVKSAGYVEVAKLKGNVGDQNYELPSDVDLATHRAVTIWCHRFGVNFGTAPLSQNSI